jgi:hypothetical protein
MTAATPVAPPPPDADTLAATTPAPGIPDGTPPEPARPAIRNDGWTPDRQARFLAAIAEGHLVRDACAMVGLSVTSAYAFRRRAGGAAFALGWAAANLHAREVLADTLLARAVEGQVETITRGDGSVVERHRYDNRLAQAMLTRLDRLAAADPATPAAASLAADAPAAPAAIDPLRAARGVAAGFDAYLDLIASDAGPARTQLFVAGAVRPAAPGLSALAQADRRLRAAEPAADAAPDPSQDATSATSPARPRNHALLDPADRAGWTATDWARAEAAGLFAFAAPAPPAPPTPPAPPSARPGLSDLPKGEFDTMLQSFEGRAKLLEHALAICDAPGPPPPAHAARVEEDAADDAPDPPRVWREDADTWRTNFIAPPGFDGWQEYDYGDPDYTRDLTEEERAIAERWEASDPARIAAAAERDAWFAAGGSPWGPVADRGPLAPPAEAAALSGPATPTMPDAPPAAAPGDAPAPAMSPMDDPPGTLLPPHDDALHRLFVRPAAEMADRGETASVRRILPAAGSLRSQFQSHRESSA